MQTMQIYSISETKRRSDCGKQYFILNILTPFLIILKKVPLISCWSKNCWTNVDECRRWSDAEFGGVWSRSTLFAYLTVLILITLYQFCPKGRIMYGRLSCHTMSDKRIGALCMDPRQTKPQTFLNTNYHRPSAGFYCQAPPHQN